jgi:regulation of enolase protein 1 (concanavalin A-like superfamily)
MKRHTAILFGALACACALMAGPGTATKEKILELRGWGKAIDPDGDCKFFVAEDALLIHVPGSATPHDLAAEIGVTNAPRVLQPVRGDFTFQVRIDGRFAPGGESTLPGRTGYNGAGIIAMLDAKHVVTLARAVLQHSGGEASHYANFEMRAAGELQRIGITSDHPLPEHGPVYLRLERRGSEIRGAVSLDGTTWSELEAKQLGSEWTKDIQTGLVSISTSAAEFNPRFSQLKLLK